MWASVISTIHDNKLFTESDPIQSFDNKPQNLVYHKIVLWFKYFELLITSDSRIWTKHEYWYDIIYRDEKLKFNTNRRFCDYG